MTRVGGFLGEMRRSGAVHRDIKWLALHNISLNRQLLEMHSAVPAISQNKQG